MSQQDYFIKFARELGDLNGNIKSVLSRLEKGDEKMAEHEARLAILEQGSKTEADEPLKNWIIKALIRIIGWGTVIVGSLVGAGELLKSVRVG